MRHTIRTAVTALFCILGSAAHAEDFDGSKPLICAPVEAMDCGANEGCTKGTPDAIGAPDFLRIDFAKKVVISPKRTTPILGMEKDAKRVLIHGMELGMLWVLAVDPAGKMTATLTNQEGVFVLFGSCTTL
jgi:hypothetical protein